ncbi:MAG: RNA pseudouridine synthase [Gammaproteobacteria bacterium]|nr:RNA pseudouridine synthase [Gammaproteobacteria bacterium]
MPAAPQRQSWELTASSDDTGSAVDYLVRHTGISKGKLKDAMIKGAVWLQRGRGKRKRLRRATSALQAGDVLILHYDAELLARVPPTASRLWHCRDYSVWYKPPGLLAQGNEYGDHASLLRQAELADPLRKPVYLIHRLDREARGLMLIAHNQTAARHLSQMFQRQQVSKLYEVKVLGKPAEAQGEINQMLDGKAARTRYVLRTHDVASNTSVLDVEIDTGRTHQIRRHLEGLGHPVMGDPRYGRGNKTAEGLQLTALRLAFTCPLTNTAREFDLNHLRQD